MAASDADGELRFEGFDPAAVHWLEQLEANNTRAWFTAHRAEYDALIRRPLEALLQQAEPRHGPGRVMRPNRDVRFSADKHPYRTTASMWAGGAGGVYLSLSQQGLEVGGGLYEPSRDQLQRARAVIDERPRPAGRLAAAVEALEGAGFEFAGPSLTTAPRGYPRDHPRIDLLRLRHYAALRHLPVDADPASITATWDAVGPLNGWIADHVGPARSWP